MRSHILLALIAGALIAAPAPARATDVDAGNDCSRTTLDMGDAPEGSLAYPGGPLGAFPTCLAAGPVGTREVCGGGTGAPPGPAGYVRHGPSPLGRYWIGCFGGAASPSGVDGSIDGHGGCGLPAECVQSAFGSLNVGQDECLGDGSDAGLISSPIYVACARGSVILSVWNCGTALRQVHLNVCIDMNRDGDWLDAFACTAPTGCANEWAVVNEAVVIGPGCNSFQSSSFRVGPLPGPAWMRVTVTDEPVGPDFPWNGSAAAPGGQFVGGETEDHPVTIDAAVPAGQGTWGGVKTLYR
jgi:hypothetical protein